MEPGTSKSPHHQKRMGPAPFASFEDLSDEVRSRMESPSEKEINVIRLPGITEQDVLTPSPDPDSRRSHHSGVSLIGAPSGHSPIPNKMKLANITPRIDISRASSSSHHDSRDSTPEREIFESTEPNVKLGLGFKEDDALELRLSTEELDFHDVSTDHATKTPHHYKHRSASPEFDELYISNSNRKDSQCSDVILLSISGRTSRVSSIGSHCSQGSGQSRLSNASHISITSGRSAYSQCSSPHKTLLETSFCGPKGSQSNLNLDNQEINEKIVLARKSNVGEAVLVEGMKASSKPKVKITAAKEEETKRPKLPRKIISKSGVEYIYIPLKGPLPLDDSSESRSTKHKKPASAPPIGRTHEPKYIRIKLKPDHCYDDNEPSTPSSSRPPTSLNLTLNKEPCSKKHARSLTNSPKLMRKDAAQGGASPSPSVPRRNSFVTLFRTGPDSPSTSSLKQKKKNTLTKKAISSTESVDSKGSKHKSSVLSLFKAKQHQKSNGMAPPVKSVKIHKPEKPKSSETIIRIPLHSPTYYENKSLLQELQASSQDSQVTVVEVAPKPIQSPEVAIKPPVSQVTVVELTPIVANTNQVTVVEVTPKPIQKASDSLTESDKCQKVDLEIIDTSLAHAEVESTETANRLLNSDSLLLETSSCHHEDHNSSESEKDSDVGEYHRKSTETERKAIVLQQDSFEDELPYVPTTLPQERSAALPILPVKQRCVLDIKTCPIERPRSTTPIQHSSLENYFDGFSHNSNGQAEKLKISLPRAETTKAKPQKEDSPPPPLPPKGIQKKSWINFEEVPERRKPPKRIQTIPSRGQIDIPGGLIKDNVVYTYVNPEECKCECHEHKDTTVVVGETNNKPIVQEDEVPLLNRPGETSTS